MSQLIPFRKDWIFNRPRYIEPGVVPSEARLPGGVIVGRLFVVEDGFVTQDQVGDAVPGRRQHLLPFAVRKCESLPPAEICRLLSAVDNHQVYLAPGTGYE